MTDMSELVQQFANAVVAQSEAIERGDSETGNRHARRYVHAWNRLREFGNHGRDALTILLTDERADVRSMAAAYLLRYRNEAATRVLREVAAGDGLVAFEAAEALQRWKEGDWHLDSQD